jgi:hypothetical protein
MASTANSMHLAVAAATDFLDRRDYTGALKYIQNCLADPHCRRANAMRLSPFRECSPFSAQR